MFKELQVKFHESYCILFRLEVKYFSMIEDLNNIKSCFFINSNFNLKILSFTDVYENVMQLSLFSLGRKNNISYLII